MYVRNQLPKFAFKDINSPLICIRLLKDTTFSEHIHVQPGYQQPDPISSRHVQRSRDSLSNLRYRGRQQSAERTLWRLRYRSQHIGVSQADSLQIGTFNREHLVIFEN